MRNRAGKILRQTPLRKDVTSVFHVKPLFLLEACMILPCISQTSLFQIYHKNNHKTGIFYIIFSLGEKRNHRVKSSDCSTFEQLVSISATLMSSRGINLTELPSMGCSLLYVFIKW